MNMRHQLASLFIGIVAATAGTPEAREPTPSEPMVMSNFPKGSMTLSCNGAISPIPLTPWRAMNDGHPIDAGDLISAGSTSVWHDHDGNLVYSFEHKRTLGTYTGRLKLDDHGWELMTSDGWSRAPGALPTPIFGVNFVAREIKAFPLPDEPEATLHIYPAGLRGGSAILDVHGAALSLITGGQNPGFWDGSTHQGNLPQPIAYDWGGALGNKLSFDLSATQGIRVGSYKENTGRPSYLTASRYSVSTRMWSTWTNDQGWQSPEGYTLPMDRYLLPLGAPDLLDPSIRNLPGTERFVVTYRSGNDVFSALFDGTAETWQIWNQGWQAPTSGRQSIATQVDHGRPSTTVVGDRLYQVVRRDPLTIIVYDDDSQSWGALPALPIGLDAAPSQGMVQVQPSGDVQVLLAISKSLYLATWDGMNWNAPEEIYRSKQPLKLEAFAQLGQSRRPVAFVAIGGDDQQRLYAVAPPDTLWQAQHVRIPAGLRRPSALWFGEHEATRDTRVTMQIDYDGVAHTLSEGGNACAPLAQDEIGRVYCSSAGGTGIGIFPSDDGPGVHWGYRWDYFLFPGQPAFDHWRGKVYIPNRRSLGGAGRVGPVGNLHIWDLSLADQSVAWRGPDFTIPPEQRYQPVIVSQVQGAGMSWASAATVDASRDVLYVSESHRDRILRFNLADTDMQGRPAFIGAWGSHGQGLMEFDTPRGLDVDADGNLYVVDTLNHRIQKISPEGTTITSWGYASREEGGLWLPYSVAIDRERDHVYITEPENARISIFDLSGQFLRSFGWWWEGGQPFGHIYHRIDTATARDGIVHFAGGDSASGGPSHYIARLRVDPSTPSIPDLATLTIHAGAFATHVADGSRCVQVTLGNHGGEVVNDDFELAFGLSRDPESTEWIPIGSTTIESPLAPGDERVVNSHVFLPLGHHGLFHIGARLDPDDQIAEAHSDNNVAWTDSAVVHLVPELIHYNHILVASLDQSAQDQLMLAVRPDNSAEVVGYSEDTSRSYQGSLQDLSFPAQPPYVVNTSINDLGATIDLEYMRGQLPPPSSATYFIAHMAIDPGELAFLATIAPENLNRSYKQGFYVGNAIVDGNPEPLAVRALIAADGQLTVSLRGKDGINTGFNAMLQNNGSFSAENADGDQFTGTVAWFAPSKSMWLSGDFNGGALGSGDFQLQREPQ